MVGEKRIIAFDAGAGETVGTSLAETQAAPAAPVDDDAWVFAEDDGLQASGGRAWLAPVIAGLAAMAWTALFAAAQLPAFRSGIAWARVPELVVQWCIPVILIGIAWLLVMRHSTREGRRFGHVAQSLSDASALLEQRLTTVNRELSLAREFITAQSRDLETLGRLSVERISQHAERLQELVRDNGARVESISTVSTAALDNMEKLRGQLPVIASSAKDVTNNIANAGRTAHAQLEDMIGGFNRLNEFGAASTRQVDMIRQKVGETLESFDARCEQIEQTLAARFSSLESRAKEFGAEIERNEAGVLASMRARADALAAEVDESRKQLDLQEAESLTSLRARLGALRDESEVVSRDVRQQETRAVEALRDTLDDLRKMQEAAGAALEDAQQTAVDAMAHRLAIITSEAQQIDEAIELRAERIFIEAQERQSRQVEQERHAIARIDHMLGELDASIAERLERHRIQATALSERAASVTAELGRFEARLETIAARTGESEDRLATSLGALTEGLAAAQGALAAADDDVEKLTDDSIRLLELVQAAARQAGEALPASLAASEERLRDVRQGLDEIIRQLSTAIEGGEQMGAQIGASGRDLDALMAALLAAQEDLGQRGAEHEALLQRLHNTLGDVDAATQRTADRAGGALVAALASLGETIDETVAAIEDNSAERITRVADRLGDESASAIEKAMRGKVAEISGQLEQSVAHASGVTREATLQLRSQIASVEELVGNLETRVASARERAEEQVDNDFARRAAVITESLNSSAIDIASVLSTEVTDNAWAAYLRGDRGIFTRRAVSLLDAGEAKAIQQIFERDDAFRTNVSRYIHDFESILRQVLSTRDGNALGVTLLSSDMGKLYVALAQGIERLRG